MTYLEFTAITERVTYLAKRKMTGTPRELALKLNVSEQLSKRFTFFTIHLI